MTTILARLALAAAGAVAGAAVWDVVWRQRLRGREEEWRDRYRQAWNYQKTVPARTDAVDRNNTRRRIVRAS